MKRRHIIVHFHFFKNAGSSVEYMLRQYFGERFLEFEPGAPAETFPATVLAPLFEKHKELQAVSSHTICFPPPSRPDWSVFPVVFLRHPLDRILSMYNYERRLGTPESGAVTARETGPGGYIASLLGTPHERTFCNYQAGMLAGRTVDEGDERATFEAASKTLGRLPVVGVVDEFDESVRQLSEWLSPYFPGLDLRPAHYNRTSPVSSRLEDRLENLRDDTGARLFEDIESKNAMDLELYRQARRRLLEAED